MSLRGASATKQSQDTMWMNGQYYVYIKSTRRNTAVYTGVTNNLKRRVYEHKEKLIDGFTKKYNITKLIYYEVFEDTENAILRQKNIKLINSVSKEWRDLYEEL